MYDCKFFLEMFVKTSTKNLQSCIGVFGTQLNMYGGAYLRNS